VLVVMASTGKAEVVRLVDVEVKLQSSQTEFESFEFDQLPLEGYAKWELNVKEALELVVRASTGEADVVRLVDVDEVRLQSNQTEFVSFKFDQLPLEG
jgi:hypothetical protein